MRFTAADLKEIAMGTMLLDHGAVALLRNTGLAGFPVWNGIYIAMRLVGRMAFPLFAFLLVEGFLHTGDVKRYALRLGALALAAEIPYDLVAGQSWFFPQEQNTVVLLFVGLLVMAGMEAVKERFGSGSGGEGKGGTRVYEAGGRRESRQIERWEGNGTCAHEAGARKRPTNLAAVLPDAAVQCALGELAAALAGCLAVHVLRADYGVTGLLLILAFYRLRYDPALRTAAACALFLVMYRADLYSIAACAALFFVCRYNGEPGGMPGWLPYLFYPAHMLLLAGAGEWLYGIYF